MTSYWNPPIARLCEPPCPVLLIQTSSDQDSSSVSRSHVIVFSDLVEKSLLSSSYVVRRESSSENTRKVCLFSSQNNKIVPSTFFLVGIHEVRKGMWVFSPWLSFSVADWLSRETPTIVFTVRINTVARILTVRASVIFQTFFPLERLFRWES